MAEADLYGHDFIAWTERQANALRAAAQKGLNLDLDWEHLAEEIEDIGKAYRFQLALEASRIVHHLLTLQFAPDDELRRNWIEAVIRARGEIDAWLDDEPGLRPRLPAIVEKGRGWGARIAPKVLETLGHHKAAEQARLHDGTYSYDQILGDWFPDARAVPHG